MRRYEASDYSTIDGWAFARGVEIAPESWLPRVGFINDKAVCFLIQTDTPVCLIEYLVAAKDALPDNIEEVAGGCIDAARTLGFKKIRVHTEMRSVENRAHRMGFRTCDNNEIIMEMRIV